MYFSEREKIIPEKSIVLGDLEKKCQNRLWNCINAFFKGYVENSELKELYIFMLDQLGYKLNPEFVEMYDDYAVEEFGQTFESEWESIEWYQHFDILEMIFKYKYNGDYAIQNIDFVKNKINVILEEEKSGYRMVNNIIVTVTNPIELGSIESALSTPFKVVNASIEKSLKLYSDLQNPDYENSIKEAITAVESMCCLICNDESVTLGQALGKLESQGIYIHGAMKDGFKKLYGYTSDENGIRHGGIDDSKVTQEDAKYMLVSCSAFINYLTEKYVKLGGKTNG